MEELNKKMMTTEQRINQLGSFPPMVQFIGVLLGAFVDVLYPWRLFPPHTSTILGFVFLLLSTALIVWSQSASAEFRKNEREGKQRTFLNGPYRYSSNPTSFGLALLTIGLGFLLNSIVIVSASVAAFWISHMIYTSRKEKILEEKYQDEYREYKKKIKTIV
jgi:protein-S-isoprenylcysteine O-methyltransferase Ste14